MSDFNKQPTENKDSIEQPTPIAVEILLRESNTNFLQVLYNDNGFVGEVARILTGQKPNPADLIDTLAQRRNDAMIIEGEASNDENFQKNGTN